MEPSTIFSICGALISSFAAFTSWYQFKKKIDIENRKAEKLETYKKLNELYQPLYQLRRKSLMLYEKFNPDYKVKGKGFRTLDLLLKGHSFSAHQNTLLEEIISIGKQCELLIHEKSGLIDDDNLRTNIFPRATTHFLVLRLAYSGKLKGRPSDYENYTFPRDLDICLQTRIKQLQNKLARNTNSI